MDLSLAAETLETDPLGLGLMNLSAITHVDTEQQETCYQLLIKTMQSLVHIPDMTPLPGSDSVSSRLS